MRELVGKIPTKDPHITDVVYLSETVRCLECQRTVPVGIEVVTVERNDEAKKVIRRVCYCRGHGLGFETKAQSLPIFVPMFNPKDRCSVSMILPGMI